MENKRLPLRKALLWIALSTLMISGSASLVWAYYQHVQRLRTKDQSYTIVAIVQTGPEREVLKTAYLAELLNLSVNQPTNLYDFDNELARKKLLESPLIKEASVKRIRPGTIYIDYVVRQPIAYLADYSNTAIDNEGYIFPFSPFFTPKKIPEIVLGLLPFGTLPNDTGKTAGSWYQPLTGPEVGLSLEIFKEFNENKAFSKTQLKRIDVANAYLESPGRREVVLILEEKVEKQIDGKFVLCLYPRLLRLQPNQFRNQLKNYIKLSDYLLTHDLQPITLNDKTQVVHANPLIVDLRIKDLAFLKS